MGYPSTTDWPGSLDGVETRADGSDVVWDDDFMYQDIQIRQIQDWLGVTGDLIGEGISAAGPGGLLSPIASGAGNRAITLAARNAFAAGDVLSVGDNYGGSYTEKLSLDYTGLLWTLGGGDFGSAEFFRLPHGNSLPASYDEARLFHKDDEDTVYVANGSGWVPITGQALSIETGRYDYVQAASPVEEVVGQWMLDGSKVPGSGAVKFRCMMTPSFGAAGWARVRVYDIGAVGTPAAPVEITDDSTPAYRMEATTDGLVYLSTSALTFAASPGIGQIVAAERMYEVTLEQDSQTSDTVDLGFAGVVVEV